MGKLKRSHLVDVAAVLAITAIFVTAYRFHNVFWPGSAAAAVPASGYGELLGCHHVSSYDGRRTLALLTNSRAVLVDDAIPNYPSQKEGAWRLVDGATHSYQISIPGVSGIYDRIEAPGVCILALGDTGATDLRHSWFSTSRRALGGMVSPQ